MLIERPWLALHGGNRRIGHRDRRRRGYKPRTLCVGSVTHTQTTRVVIDRAAIIQIIATHRRPLRLGLAKCIVAQAGISGHILCQIIENLLCAPIHPRGAQLLGSLLEGPPIRLGLTQRRQCPIEPLHPPITAGKCPLAFSEAQRRQNHICRLGQIRQKQILHNRKAGIGRIGSIAHADKPGQTNVLNVLNVLNVSNVIDTLRVPMRIHRQQATVGFASVTRVDQYISQVLSQGARRWRIELLVAEDKQQVTGILERIVAGSNLDASHGRFGRHAWLKAQNLARIAVHLG